MATINVQNWSEKNSASVTDPGSTPTGIQKVQPLRVTWNNGSSGTGPGDAEFIVDITSQDELVVTESDESTTRPYEVAYFDAPA